MPVLITRGRTLATPGLVRPLFALSGEDMILDRVLDGKGIGWSLLRYALILGPAVIVIIVLCTAFPFD